MSRRIKVVAVVLLIATCAVASLQFFLERSTESVAEGFGDLLQLVSVEIGKMFIIQKGDSTADTNAKLVDALVRAMEVADHVRDDPAGRDPGNRHADPWGHPYCIASSKETVVVISQGPSAETLFCNQKHLNSQLLTDIPRRRLIKSERGHLILLVDRRAGGTESH